MHDSFSSASFLCSSLYWESMAAAKVASQALAGSARFRDQPGKKGAGKKGVHTLRVPLYAHNPFRALPFDGFHHAVGSVGGHAQAAPRAANALVVGAVDAHAGAAGQFGQPATRKAHGM